MSTSALIQAMIVAMVAVAIAVAFLAILRKMLTPRAPRTAEFLGVIATIVLSGVAASSLGLNLVGTLIWLIPGTFIGFIAVQPRPREMRSLLLGLALAAGSVVLYAAMESNLIATVVGIGVCGLLLKVAGPDGRDSEGD